MTAALPAADLAPFDEVVLAARPLLVDRVTRPRRDAHGVERVVTPADQPVVLCS